ncbi:hypothetical protein FRC03_005504 [Tulasnella sp. 419]|nr:hypothetical protein FRC03_005504 [Tulasnella sp. 419]
MIANLKDESGANIKGTALYKGGSGGAFEEFYPRLRAGTVVAIMSPKVLRPYQGKTNNDSKTLHPTNNILAISPTTADTIKIIGHSKDLGMCEVKLKNGGVCGSWCDKRVTQVCEYHMIAAVRSKKNQRAEFSAGTSSVGLTPIPSNAHKSGPSNRNSKAFDPSAKWGLLPSAATTSRPRSDGQGSTYVMSGGMVISSSDAQHISAKKQKEFNEKIRKAKDKREKDDEELLKKLFSKDAGSVGMREVKSAQAYLKKVKGKEKETGGLAEQEEEEDEDTREREKRRSKLRNVAYNPQVLKRLGFDPTLRPGEMPKTKTDSSAHRFLPKRNADIDLGPKPGPRIRSGVIVPPEKRFELNRTSETKTDASKDPKIYDAPVIFDSDDELEFEDDNEEGGERNEETSPREDPLDHELEMEAVNGESDVGYQQDGSSDEEVILSNRRRRSIVDDEEDMDIDVHSD